MTSEDLPRSQDAGTFDEAGPGPTDSTPREPQPQQYPAARYNTGEYRQPLAAPGSDDSPNTGPLGEVPPPVWQPRPSGALSTDAWASPSSPALYGPDSSTNYGTGSYQAAPHFGQIPGAQPPQFGGTASYPAYGRPEQLAPTGPSRPGDASMGSASTVSAVRTAKSRSGVTRALVAAMVALLVLAGCFGAGWWGSETARQNAVADSSLTQQQSSPVVSDAQPVAASNVESVAGKLLPSVVSILSLSSSQSAEGSGVILTSDGLILTNNHVIAGATELTVRFNDGATASAKVVGSDATDDLAVLQASGVSGLTKAALGSSANVKVGEQVVAVGSPLGLSATVTSGIISALNRPVRTAAEQQPQDPTGGSSQQSTTQDTVLNAIQTDAAINPGNSGGALVDMSGKVIGINSAIASLSSGSGQSGSIGVGFAIPIDQAYRIAQEIINNGHATHAVLGASVGDAPDSKSANPTAAARAGLSVGAKIASVTAGGGAAGAGLLADDVVTKIGSSTVGSADALIATIRSAKPGSQVVITYVRGTATKTATVTLGSAVSK